MEKVVDVLKLAIGNEIKAKVFYGKASEITQQGESQMVFLELTEMEDQHARRLVDHFGDLLSREGHDAAEQLRRSEAETEKTLSVEETALIRNGDMRAVIQFAIGMEERARDTYQDLARRFERADARTFCEDLAAEEQRHYDTLSQLLIAIDMPMDERPAL
jgi:rubrerythrin